MRTQARASRSLAGPGACLALLGLAFLITATTSGRAATPAPAPPSAQALRPELERSLPAGQPPHFYWQVMAAMGYDVEDIDFAKDDHVTFEVVKDHEAYDVRLDLEEGQARVTEVEVRSIDTDDLDGNVDGDDYAAVAAGTMIPVTLGNYLSSEESERGDEFTLTVTESVDADVPEGTVITGKVASVRPAERPHRAGKLVLEATSMRLRGEDIDLAAAITADGTDLDEDDEGLKEDIADLKDVGIGAAVGAAIGGIIKGTKGALAGLIIGGAGTFIAREGEEVELTPGTPLVLEVLRDVDLSNRR